MLTHGLDRLAVPEASPQLPLISPHAHLHALTLGALAAAWTEQQQQADMTALACDERLALLVEAEWRARENTRLARADGPSIRLLGKLARVDVLVIDDWGLAPVQDQERRDLLEILEDRSGTRSTIHHHQFPPAQWHDDLADAPLADAICDRLLHTAHRLVSRGPSRRKEAKLDA
jgi:hypothetical protein